MRLFQIQFTNSWRYHRGELQEGLDGLKESLGCKWTRSDAIHAIREVYQMLFDEDAARVTASSSSSGPNPELRESYAAALLSMVGERLSFSFLLRVFLFLRW